LKNGSGSNCRFPIIMRFFTVPGELRRIIRSHEKIYYALLMEAAALSRMKLASGSKELSCAGARPVRALPRYVYHPGAQKCA
jgi:hypothetical protein